MVGRDTKEWVQALIFGGVYVGWYNLILLYRPYTDKGSILLHLIVLALTFLTMWLFQWAFSI